MADLVVGLSKTAVQLLADKVKSAIKEEAEQWKIVQRDLVFITGEFEMMQSFLDTTSEEHVRNRIVRTWVRQVRDLSHDVEDNIDFVLHLDPTKRSWWLRLLPSCGRMAAPLPVDEAVAETTLLRAQVVDVSQRNIRYNLIADSASKPMPAAMDLVPVQKTASSSSFDVLINAVKKSGPLDLAGLISSDYTDLHVVSVCGTEGDLGKVAIVRKAYGDARVSKKFEFRAWVKLMHRFNPHQFIRSLVTQFFTHTCQEHEVNVGLDALEKVQQATQSDLIKEFAHKESNHRYLIVLEDLCSMVQWDAIRTYLPDRKKGSRIVVLTHHPVVASQCTGEPCRVSEIEQFSAGQSVRVYYKEGFQHVQSFIKAKPHHSLSSYGLLGRHTEIDELLKKSQESRLISVWGMPGVGKSALVQATYWELMRKSDEFKRHVWISVSHPFNPTDFCRSLLVNMHRESRKGEYAKALQAEDPIKECRDHLHESVCLLVIDGVQSNEEWDWIKSNLIQYGDSRSCIITITSEECLAKHCAVSSIDGVYNIKGLQAAAADELFKKVLDEERGFYPVKWNKEREYTSSEQKAEAKEAVELILSKCGGLPRVITTVAQYLARKRSDLVEPEMRRMGIPNNFIEKMRRESETETFEHEMMRYDMMRCLNRFVHEERQVRYIFLREMRRLSDNFIQVVATNPGFDFLPDIEAWMHSYFHACPRHLKKHMLYLSIFPPDIIIRRRRLIRRWIAEGYSKGNDSNSMEKHAEKFFDEVAALSILQPVLDTGKVIGYQVNYFFREFIMSRPVEETLFFPVEVSALENQGHGRLTTEGIGQHLAIGSTWQIDRVALDSMDLSRLRSLTVFLRFRSFFVSDRMRVLRVLDLENARGPGVHYGGFEEIAKLPSRLKFFLVRGQRGVRKLPESVGDLLQLQTLDIRDTSIVTLPPFITKLRKLQYIRAGTTHAWTDDDSSSSDDAEEGSSSRSHTLASCLPKFLRSGGPVVGSRSGGVVVPRGIIKGLKALQTLGAVHLNTADGEAILNEILSLPQLKKLEVSGISGKQGPWSLFFLDNKTHLESLSLQFEKHNHFAHWKKIDLPRCLRSLKMYGHVIEVSGEMICCLDNLVKLTLEMSTLFTEKVIERLGCIRNLQILRLRVIKDQDAELQFPNKDLFRKLQVLQIACKSKLHVGFDQGAMGKLENVKLHCLQGSEMQVSGLEHLASLKKVWLLGSFEDALKEALQQQLDRHPKIPGPKLETVCSDLLPNY